jgi:hypothetical protein
MRNINSADKKPSNSERDKAYLKKIIHRRQDGEYGKVQKQYRFQAALFIHLDFPKPFQTTCRLKSCCPSKQPHGHPYLNGCTFGTEPYPIKTISSTTES